MQHEKVFKREDGSQVKVTVMFGNNGALYGVIIPYYKFDLEVKCKGKRLWKRPYSIDDYDYRRLSHSERLQWLINEKMKYVSKEELHGMYVELWNMLKPEL